MMPSTAEGVSWPLGRRQLRRRDPVPVQLYPVATIVGGMLLLPVTPEVIEGFIAEAEAAPDELSTIANIMPAPRMPFVPAEHHGRLVAIKARYDPTNVFRLNQNIAPAEEQP